MRRLALTILTLALTLGALTAFAQTPPTTDERVTALEARVATLEAFVGYQTPTPTATATPEPTATPVPTATPTATPTPWADCSVIARTADQWRLARTASLPGQVICLAPGVYRVSTPFEVRRSGTPDAWITYRSMDPANPATIKGSAGAWDLFQVYSAGYIEVSDLVFDGENTYSNGIACKGGHHIRALRNTLRNMGSGGIVAYRDPNGVGCDYLTIADNRIAHSGYKAGWSSAISLNGMRWHDQAESFHSIIARNIMTGSYDASTHHSDGNGVILDVSGSSPPVLITNNVVSINGGRCLHALNTNNGWWLNNTCYGNGLDPAVAGGALGNNGEFVLYGSSGHVAANNILTAVGDGRAISDERGTPARMYANLTADPRYTDPPPAVDGGYATAPAPDADLVRRLTPLPDSPAIGAGVDLRTLPGLTPAFRADVERWAMADVLGRPRPDAIWHQGAILPTP